MNDIELGHLRRCVELATEALDAGDEPFGSVLAAATEHFWRRTETGSRAATTLATPSSSWLGGRLST